MPTERKKLVKKPVLYVVHTGADVCGLDRKQYENSVIRAMKIAQKKGIPICYGPIPELRASFLTKAAKKGIDLSKMIRIPYKLKANAVGEYASKKLATRRIKSSHWITCGHYRDLCVRDVAAVLLKKAPVSLLIGTPSPRYYRNLLNAQEPTGFLKKGNITTLGAFAKMKTSKLALTEKEWQKFHTTGELPKRRWIRFRKIR